MSKKISFFHPASLIATCFGIGKFPYMPGTLGSIFGVVMIIIVAFLPKMEVFPENLLLVVIAALATIIYFVGWWASSVYSRKTGKNDPSEVVIDEVAGIFIAVALFGAVYAVLLSANFEKYLRLLVIAPYYLLTIFVFFRFFDIKKPGLIKWSERRFKGGAGIMIDDAFAAVYTVVAFYVTFYAMLYSGMFKYIFSKFYPHFAGFL